MTQFGTKASALEQAATTSASFEVKLSETKVSETRPRKTKFSEAKLSEAKLSEAKLRQAAVMLTLAFGVPLVLAWFGLLGWGVVWLARSALSL